MKLDFTAEPFDPKKTESACAFLCRRANDKELHIVKGKLWKIETYYRPMYDCEIIEKTAALCSATCENWQIVKSPKIGSNICSRCADKNPNMPIYAQAPKSKKKPPK